MMRQVNPFGVPEYPRGRALSGEALPAKGSEKGMPGASVRFGDFSWYGESTSSRDLESVNIPKTSWFFDKRRDYFSQDWSYSNYDLSMALDREKEIQGLVPQILTQFAENQAFQNRVVETARSLRGATGPVEMTWVKPEIGRFKVQKYIGEGASADSFVLEYISKVKMQDTLGRIQIPLKVLDEKLQVLSEDSSRLTNPRLRMLPPPQYLQDSYSMDLYLSNVAEGDVVHTPGHVADVGLAEPIRAFRHGLELLKELKEVTKRPE